MKMSLLEQIKEYLHPITRGAIDGSLSTLGIVIGAVNASPEIIIAAGMSGGIANGFSNMFAAVSAEKTEMLGDLSEIEDAMLKDTLRDTIIHEMQSKKVRSRGFIDGVATIFGALVPVVPYFFLGTGQAIFLSIGLTSLLAFFLGFAMAQVSGRNILYLGLKMAIIAIIVAIASTSVRQLIEAGFKGSLLHPILGLGLCV
ncbi:TIGR00267 family protein [archaeon SCG-AAA382B04]|nr:TIGR00267 family protein [archaeon SCG-AAA382B04]